MHTKSEEMVDNVGRRIGQCGHGGYAVVHGAGIDGRTTSRYKAMLYMISLLLLS